MVITCRRAYMHVDSHYTLLPDCQITTSKNLKGCDKTLFVLLMKQSQTRYIRTKQNALLKCVPRLMNDHWKTSKINVTSTKYEHSYTILQVAIHLWLKLPEAMIIELVKYIKNNLINDHHEKTDTTAYACCLQINWHLNQKCCHKKYDSMYEETAHEEATGR